MVNTEGEDKENSHFFTVQSQKKVKFEENRILNKLTDTNTKEEKSREGLFDELSNEVCNISKLDETESWIERTQVITKEDHSFHSNRAEV